MKTRTNKRNLGQRTDARELRSHSYPTAGLNTGIVAKPEYLDTPRAYRTIKGDRLQVFDQEIAIGSRGFLVQLSNKTLDPIKAALGSASTSNLIATSPYKWKDNNYKAVFFSWTPAANFPSYSQSTFISPPRPSSPQSLGNYNFERSFMSEYRSQNINPYYQIHGNFLSPNRYYMYLVDRTTWGDGKINNVELGLNNSEWYCYNQFGVKRTQNVPKEHNLLDAYQQHTTLSTGENNLQTMLVYNHEPTWQKRHQINKWLSKAK
jgi:hypothetical protein